MCRVLIISYKLSIITGISNEKTNELTIYAIVCQNVTKFCHQELASFFQVREKLKACSNSKWNFSSSFFIADDSQIKTARLHVVVFSEHDIFNFWDNVHLLKYYPLKVTQNFFNSFSCSYQTGMQVPKFSFGPDK